MGTLKYEHKEIKIFFKISSSVKNEFDDKLH